MPSSLQALVVFSVDGRQFAMDVGKVESVHRCVEISPLPSAPRGVRGVINVRGSLLPVFDLRVTMGGAPREERASDHLIITRTLWHTVALLVDHVAGVVPYKPEDLIPASTILPGLHSVSNALTVEGEIILMHDLDAFLSQEEHQSLQLTMEL